MPETLVGDTAVSLIEQARALVTQTQRLIGTPDVSEGAQLMVARKLNELAVAIDGIRPTAAAVNAAFAAGRAEGRAEAIAEQAERAKAGARHLSAVKNSA